MNRLVALLFRTVAIGVCLLLSGCAFIESGSISEASGSGSQVTATCREHGLFHLGAPLNITSEANAELVKQCQSGILTDVQTELSMRDWFLIVQQYTLTASAVCK